MARTKISEFSATAADNTDIDNIDIAEGCAPSGINNAIRELMAQLKDMQTGASGDTFTLTTVNSTAVNATTVDATNLEVTNLKAKDGTAAGSIADSTGVVTLTSLTGTTADYTNLEVTNLKAKDGTAAGSIADSTGVVTLDSTVLTTTDINGGTVDGAVIGGATPAAATFTTLATSDGAISPQTGFKNRIINGGMTIDQRNAGASVTVNSTANTYSVDRFYGVGQSADGVFTLQQDTSAPVGFINSLKATVTTADASIGATQIYRISQSIEGQNTLDLGFGSANAKTVTVSFWVRSSLTGTFGGHLANSGFTRAYPFTYTISVADTWEYKTVTVAGDTSGTWLTTNGIGITVSFIMGMGSTYTGTANAWNAGLYFAPTGGTNVIGTLNATFYITGVQLEKGSTATPFEFRSIGTELGLCQRYYESSSFPAATFDLASTTALPVFVTDTGRAAGVKFTCPKRAAPTVTIYSRNNTAGKVSFVATGSDNGGTASAGNISSNGWSSTVIGTAATAGVGVEIGYTATAEL
jgi:hypothetical protein